MTNCSGMRPVQAQAGADLRDLLGAGGVAGEHRRRVARRQAQHQEHQHRHDQQHRHGGQQPAREEVSVHAGPRRRRADAARSCSVLLQVPVDVAVGDEEAADVLARRHRLRRTRPAARGCRSRRRARGSGRPASSSSASSVARMNWLRSSTSLSSRGPAEPGRTSRRVCPCVGLAIGFQTSNACQAVRNMCQPPLSGASFLARRPTSGLPVHRLQVDLEAGLAQQLRGHVGQLLDRGQVGRLHDHDRRAVVAAGLQQLLRLLHVALATGCRCRPVLP